MPATDVTAELRSPLVSGAERLGIELDQNQTGRLIEFVALLERWNRRFNLTAIREPEAMIAGHLLDSLSVLPHLRGPRVADVGSGAGLPGLPLAVAEPALEVLLIDSNGKKVRFMNEAVRHLGLENVAVRRGRVEDYRPTAPFDTVVIRAVAALPKLVRLAGHLVAPSGAMLAQKGRYPGQELDALPKDWRAEVIELDVPGIDKERHLVLLTHV